MTAHGAGGAAASGQRPRITDVARVAGVSPTTVSHALSGARSVREETRERVLAAVRELGYVPDRVATGLRRQRTGIIGFVGSGIATTPFAGELIAGAHDAASERDVLLLVVDSQGDEALEARQIELLLGQRVDGIAIARMFHQAVDRPEIPIDVPVALVNAESVGGWLVDAVAPDEEEIGRIAGRRLLEAGHRRIVFANTVDDTLASRGREAGLRAALAEAGVSLRVADIAHVASTAEGGREAAVELLDRPNRPTAVFCFNDQVAMGVMQVAHSLGIDVPCECSVIGVDDLANVADALVPKLTTIRLPHEEMGRWAVTRLLDRVAGEDLDVESATIPCRLVERESVAPAPR